jgi:hypothetical protein
LNNGIVSGINVDVPYRIITCRPEEPTLLQRLQKLDVGRALVEFISLIDPNSNATIDNGIVKMHAVVRPGAEHSVLFASGPHLQASCPLNIEMIAL